MDPFIYIWIIMQYVQYKWSKTRLEDPRWAWVNKSVECDTFSSVLWHCWLGDRKVIGPVKSWVLVFLVVVMLCMYYSSSCHQHLHYSCSNNIQNGDILVPVTGLSWKTAIKRASCRRHPSVFCYCHPKLARKVLTHSHLSLQYYTQCYTRPP